MFIVCSGSHHLVNDSSLFTELTPIVPRLIITASEQSNLYAVAVGSVKFNTMSNGAEFPIEISEAYYVPMLHQSTISISQLIRKGVQVLLTDTSCSIMIQSNHTSFPRHIDGSIYEVPVKSQRVFHPCYLPHYTEQCVPQIVPVERVKSHFPLPSNQRKSRGRHSRDRASSWRSRVTSIHPARDGESIDSSAQQDTPVNLDVSECLTREQAAITTVNDATHEVPVASIVSPDGVVAARSSFAQGSESCSKADMPDVAEDLPIQASLQVLRSQSCIPLLNPDSTLSPLVPAICENSTSQFCVPRKLNVSKTASASKLNNLSSSNDVCVLTKQVLESAQHQDFDHVELVIVLFFTLLVLAVNYLVNIFIPGILMTTVFGARVRKGYVLFVVCSLISLASFYMINQPHDAVISGRCRRIVVSASI